MPDFDYYSRSLIQRGVRTKEGLEYEMSHLKSCPYPLLDCQSKLNGRCKALSDPSFEGKFCPFYRSRDLQSTCEYEKRMLRSLVGRVSRLIDIYGAKYEICDFLRDESAFLSLLEQELKEKELANVQQRH